MAVCIPITSVTIIVDNGFQTNSCMSSAMIIMCVFVFNFPDMGAISHSSISG